MSLAGDFGLLESDLSECVELCSSTVCVTRFKASKSVDGYPDGAPTETLDVAIAVQPMNQKELRNLPEGERTDGRVKGFTPTQLHTVKTSECRKADEFEHKGVKYKVVRVDSWVEAGAYFRIEAVRLDR